MRFSADDAVDLVLEVDQLVADGQDRVEGGHRVLEHHGDVRPAQVALAFRVQGEEVGALVADGAGIHPGIGGQQVDERGGERGLAAAAFADDADHLAGVGVKVGGAQRLHRPMPAS